MVAGMDELNLSKDFRGFRERFEGRQFPEQPLLIDKCVQRGKPEG
jgi:hypothetical protein